jgi:hypothetical protein
MNFKSQHLTGWRVYLDKLPGFCGLHHIFELIFLSPRATLPI